MRQIIDTLAQLQRMRDKSVKDITVQLAKQKQICANYDNNIRALGNLLQQTEADESKASVESLKNMTGYKGSLRQVIQWQEQEKTLAQIKENHIRKNLVVATCEEKVVAMTLEDRRNALNSELDARQQKTSDEIATQCWLRQRGLS